ncbi:MAG TPA: glycosyltransferase family 39 protein [Candidatus Acidoferrales bacterium]|nr:glycosyltransferase family 39 protein [Candidatus Acidoferrales bacterium]
MNALRRVAVDVRILVALLVVAVIPRLPTLGQPLLEQHSFRQTWTAWTAELFHERGFDLFRPLVPIFGPPFVLPSEFPLFQTLGAVVMTLGVPTDPAMRIAGLVTFIGCAVALWLFARDLSDGRTALVAVAIFVTTPLALLWSRTSMIEYLALGAGIAYVWAGMRWRDGRGPRWWPVALLFGVVAALVKPPTFAACAIPLFLARDRIEPAAALSYVRTRLDPRLIALGAIPLAASLAWLAYGDSIKATEPAASFLQSTGPLWRTYYYGSFANRVDPIQLDRVGGELTTLAIGRFVVAFVALGIAAAVRAPRASLWAGIIASIVLPIEIFWGAYRQHDYYFVAVSAQLALLAAAGAMWSWRRMRTNTARAVVGALVVATIAASLWYDSGYWTRTYDNAYDPGGLAAPARLIAADTRPTDDVLVVGLGYDPTVLYYAKRDGLMLTNENLSNELLRSIPHGLYRTMFVSDPWSNPLWISRAWRWVGSRAFSLYRMADAPAGVADAFVIATDEPSVADVAAAGRVLTSAPLRIPCGFDGLDVPSGGRGTLLELRIGYPIDARLDVGHAGSPLPARHWVWLPAAATPSGGMVRVTCGGASELVVDRVIDAALDLH